MSSPFLNAVSPFAVRRGCLLRDSLLKVHQKKKTIKIERRIITPKVVLLLFQKLFIAIIKEDKILKKLNIIRRMYSVLGENCNGKESEKCKRVKICCKI
jgi:hypothetical protein